MLTSITLVGRLWQLAPHPLSEHESPIARCARYAIGVYYAIFFLLALRNDALHLRWLSRLAWIVRSPARLARLMEATSAKEIHAAMSEAAGELPGALKPTGAPAGR